MNSQVFDFIILILGFCFGAISMWFLLKLDFYNKSKNNEVETIQKIKDTNIINLITTEGYFDKVNNLIDSFIKEASDYYTILALSSNSTHYLNEAETEKMQKYIYGTVKKNMTDEVKDVISTVYNIDSDEKLNSLLNLRINMHVINFIRNYNSLPEDLPNISELKNK